MWNDDNDMKTMRRMLLFIMLLMTLSYAYADIHVNPQVVKGPIKCMNATNNGPWRAGTDQVRDNFEDFKNARIPFARTHDSSFCAEYGGEHVVDITAIFPDFSKDVNDPDSYDFTLTDIYLNNIYQAGAGIFFRLGQKIEHHPKKYGIMPPSDYKKWAQICEHIIRHYNEGWANGVTGDNILYWEIWNEPDLDGGDRWKTDPRTWGGSKEEFFKFYEIVANHLNNCFPHLKIGGPAVCSDEVFAEEFLSYMSGHKVKMDFFSWHCYSNEPRDIMALADRMRARMDKYGYPEAESILDEWNYNCGWTDTYPASVRTMNDMKGAAFVATTIIGCQAHPVDMLMYYDAQPGMIFNALFDYITLAPKPAYYALYGWSNLRDLGTEVESTCDEKDIYATAAKDDAGNVGIFIARYNEDNNVIARKRVKIHVNGLTSGQKVIGHITDDYHLYTERPLIVTDDGCIEAWLEPHAFLMVEISK